MSKETSGGVAVGFPGLLCLLFIALKLMGYIDWSWLWVLSPLWIPLLAGIIFFGVILGVGLAIYITAAILSKMN